MGVIAAMIMAGLSGSAVANTAAVAALLVPMRSANYPNQPLRWVNRFRRDHCANYSPSIPFIIFGVSSGFVDQQALFMAGIAFGHHDGRGAYAHGGGRPRRLNLALLGLKQHA
ncbi:TRAP transporter large permease subunit [Salmonella enterica subsp. enterica]|nr:TRAP transporter large permease subunit [Salmonella enterica subsp. enterica]